MKPPGETGMCREEEREKIHERTGLGGGLAASGGGKGEE